MPNKTIKLSSQKNEKIKLDKYLIRIDELTPKKNYWMEFHNNIFLKTNNTYKVSRLITKYIKKKANEKYIELL
jgi:hypothetical protein